MRRHCVREARSSRALRYGRPSHSGMPRQQMRRMYLRETTHRKLLTAEEELSFAQLWVEVEPRPMNTKRRRRSAP